MIRIEFVKIKAMRFPVFMNTESEIKIRLLLEPRDMSEDFAGFEVAIVAIKIGAFGVLAATQRKTGRIKTRAKPSRSVTGP